jgi:hypothetical protein
MVEWVWWGLFWGMLFIYIFFFWKPGRRSIKLHEKMHNVVIVTNSDCPHLIMILQLGGSVNKERAGVKLYIY